MARKSKRKIAVLDFETDPFKYGRMPQPFAAGYYDGDIYKEFWGENCWLDLGNFLMTQNVTVYAHNGGKFDFFYLLEFLNYKLDDLNDKEFKLINGRIAVAQCGQAELRDSYLILPMPLSAFKKDEVDYTIFEADQREKPKNKKIISSYLKSDCLYLYELVFAFIERFGKKLTVAGTAFSELGKTGYLVNRRTSPAYDEKFRAFYYGGRCEAIKPGTHSGHFKYIDINSAYPFAMKSAHPYGPKYFEISGDDLDGELPDNDVYFANIMAVSKGALPIRNEKTKEITFPNDNIEREYNASGWEIRAGLDTGTLKIIKINSILLHEETKDFSEYVDKFYAEKAYAKKIKDKIGEIFAKLLLTSAYGKFGQDGTGYKSYFLFPTGFNPLTDEDRAMADSLKITPGEYLVDWLMYEEESETPAGFTIWSKPDPVDDFYNVATAASITAYVRSYLWRSICACKNPVYCDTDSIICESSGVRIGTELGEWSLDAETTKKGKLYIGGKKLYTFKDKDKKVHKANKGARLSHDQIVDIVQNKKTFEWFNDAPSFSLKFGIYPGIDFGEKDLKTKRTGFIKRRIRSTA